jgi:hypothetical protein
MFIRRPVQSGERFAHHRELHLAVPLKNFGIALPQHLGYKVVCNAAGTQSGSECVPEVVEGEISNTGSFQSGGPSFLQ